MASYIRPNAAEVVNLTGLNALITGSDQTLFLQALEQRIQDGEDECAAVVGESTFDGSSWTARQARMLSRATAYRTAALALDVPWLQVATGTQEPLLMDPDEIENVQAALLARAQGLEALVTSGTEQRPFAMPAFGSSTFTRSASDRTPSERNALLNESDDVAADDVENG